MWTIMRRMKSVLNIQPREEDVCSMRDGSSWWLRSQGMFSRRTPRMVFSQFRLTGQRCKVLRLPWCAQSPRPFQSGAAHLDPGAVRAISCSSALLHIVRADMNSRFETHSGCAWMCTASFTNSLNQWRTAFAIEDMPRLRSTHAGHHIFAIAPESPRRFQSSRSPLTVCELQTLHIFLKRREAYENSSLILRARRYCARRRRDDISAL